MFKTMYSTVAVLLVSSVGLVAANNGGPLATCPLVNHPDGNYNPPGKALYGLVMTDFDGEHRIMFDFEFAGANMKLSLYENRLRIFGRAMARVLIDGVWEPTNLWRINFLYQNTIEVDDGGIPDIQVLGSDNSYGTFINLESGNSYDVYNKANDVGGGGDTSSDGDSSSSSSEMVNVPDHNGVSFLLGDSTGHGYRLTEHEIAELSFGGDLAIEGAGWLDLVNQAGGASPRDFLFVAIGCV